jgi:hypothetical protein
MAMVAWIACAHVIVAVLAWRFAPTWAALPVAAVTLAVLAYFGLCCHASARRAWLPLSVILSVVAAAPLIPLLWPCDVACHGGGAYAHVMAVPLHMLAVVGGLVLALFCASTRSKPAEMLGWLMAGCSLYFIVLSWRLSLLCPSCLAAHTCVLAIAALMLGGAVRARTRMAFALIAALAIHALYNPGPFAAAAPAPTAVLDDVEADAVGRIERGRRSGDPGAPLVLEILIDFQCPVCADVHDALRRELTPAIAAGDIETVVRLRSHAFDDTATHLQQWAYAAAGIDKNTWDAYVAAMLGSKTGTALHALRTQAGELVDIVAIEREAARHRAAIARVSALDDRRFAKLKFASDTPQIALLARESDTIIERWHGHVDNAAVIAAIRANTKVR